MSFQTSVIVFLRIVGILGMQFSGSEFLGYEVAVRQLDEPTCWSQRLAKCRLDCIDIHTSDASLRHRCQHDCEFSKPLEMRLRKDFCHNKANHQFHTAASVNARRLAHQKCGLLAELGKTGPLVYPDWLLNYKACTRKNITFTGSAPTTRTGKPSCWRLPHNTHLARVERQMCYKECFNAIPVLARVYHIECKDALLTNVPKNLTREEYHSFSRGNAICWEDTAERIVNEMNAGTFRCRK